MGLKEQRPGQLEQLRQRVDRLTQAGFRRWLMQLLSAAAMKQVADEFRGERDPYGNAWQQLAPTTRKAGKRDKAKILRLTGIMAASAAAVPSTDSFTFTMAFPAPVHQHGAFVAPHSRLGRAHTEMRSGPARRDRGTGRFLRPEKAAILVRAKRATYANGITIPQRQILPMKSTGGLGPIWAKAFNTEARNLCRRVLGAA